MMIGVTTRGLAAIQAEFMAVVIIQIGSQAQIVPMCQATHLTTILTHVISMMIQCHQTVQAVVPMIGMPVPLPGDGMIMTDTVNAIQKS